MGEDLLSDKVEHSGTAASRLMYWWFFEDLIGFLTWKRKGQIAKWPNVYLVSFENPRIEIVFTAHERVGDLISSTIPLTDAGSKRFFRLWMGLINRSRASYSDILSSFLPDGHDIMTKRTMLLISCKPLKLIWHDVAFWSSRSNHDSPTNLRVEYLLSNVLGMTQPLTDIVPTNDAGIHFAIIVNMCLVVVGWREPHVDRVFFLWILGITGITLEPHHQWWLFSSNLVWLAGKSAFFMG